MLWESLELLIALLSLAEKLNSFIYKYGNVLPREMDIFPKAMGCLLRTFSINQNKSCRQISEKKLKNTSNA